MDSIRVKHEDGVFKPLKKLRKLKVGAIGEERVDDVHIEATCKRPSVRSSEFFGLWKNQNDMGDGLSYVRKASQQVALLTLPVPYSTLMNQPSVATILIDQTLLGVAAP